MSPDLNLPPTPYDAYGPIECFIRGAREEGRVYVLKAPDKTMFTAAALAGPLVAVEGTITINAMNGRLVYRKTGVTDYGALLCEKIEDTLTPYVPEEWRPTV